MSLQNIIYVYYLVTQLIFSESEIKQLQEKFQKGRLPPILI